MGILNMSGQLFAAEIFLKVHTCGDNWPTCLIILLHAKVLKL